MSNPSNASTSTPASPPSSKIRFLLLSDTHSHPLHSSTDRTHAYRSSLPKADVLIHAGDLSFSGRIEEYRRTFEVVRDADAEVKIVIPGNHDWSLDRAYFSKMMKGRKSGEEVADLMWEASELWRGEEARRKGVLFLGAEEEGTRWVQLSVGRGFNIWTTPYTPEFCNMAFPYERNQDRFNIPSQSPTGNPNFTAPNPAPSWPEVDVMVSHGPPMHHMDGALGFDGSYEPVGCTNQLHALRRVRPRLSVFGHIHEGWGAERVDWGPLNYGEDVGRGLESKEGGEVTKLEVRSDDTEVLDKGYAHLDASEGGGQTLKWGEESLLVNAAILTQRGRPDNAPWVVDLDFPRQDRQSKS